MNTADIWNLIADGLNTIYVSSPDTIKAILRDPKGQVIVTLPFGDLPDKWQGRLINRSSVIAHSNTTPIEWHAWGMVRRRPCLEIETQRHTDYGQVMFKKFKNAHPAAQQEFIRLFDNDQDNA